MNAPDPTAGRPACNASIRLSRRLYADLEQVIDMRAVGDANQLQVDALDDAGRLLLARDGRALRARSHGCEQLAGYPFGFMTVDWDGRIRMNPSSPYAIQRLIGLKDRFHVAFA
jgi:phosphoglucomutase